MRKTCLAVISLGALAALILLVGEPGGQDAQPVAGARPLPALRPGNRTLPGERSAEPPRVAKARPLRVICRDADSGQGVAGALVEREGGTRTHVAGEGGVVVLEGCRPADVVVVDHPGYHGRRITLPEQFQEECTVRMVALGADALVRLQGSVLVHEDLREAPRLTVAAPTVIKRGVHRENGGQTLRRQAWLPRIRLPLTPEGSGRFRFDVKVPPRGPLTLHAQGVGRARDPDGTYRGDEVFVDLLVLEQQVLETAVRERRPLTCELVLRREAQVIELRVSDSGDRPLGRSENLVVSAQHHDLGPAGLNSNVVVAAEGSVVRIFGMPALTRLVVQATGFETRVLPVGASSFADRIESPAFLDVRLHRAGREAEEARVLAVLEADQQVPPELALLDAPRSELQRTPFTRADSGLWTVSARHRGGGPFEVFAFLEHGTVHLDGVMLVPGENRIDLPQPRGAAVGGRVLLRGAPLEGAEVSWLRAGCHLRDALTDARGRFSLEGVLEGAVTLRVTHAKRRLRRTFNTRTGGDLVLEVAPR